MVSSRNRNRSRCGQALVEFVFVLFILLVVCVEIYQMIAWSRDSIRVQGASWFVARSETFDFLHNQTPEGYVQGLLGQAVFDGKLPGIELHTDYVGSASDVEKYVGGDVPIVSDGILAALYLLAAPSLDISLIRTGTVSVDTPDYFEKAPFDLAKSATHEKNGRRYFTSEASSKVYASWTSAAQNHDFNESKANSNYSNGKNNAEQIAAKKKELEREAAAEEQKAQYYWKKYQTAQGPYNRELALAAYETAEYEAQRLRQAAESLDQLTVSPTSDLVDGNSRG